ncbi:glycosyltransferase family 2 protein [Bradyrhizobium sp. 173]|nr:glycosyltransferase family 2 protein [Bradyrhizobium sp. 173]
MAILVACYNRASITIANLLTLHDVLVRKPGLRFTIFLLDDASPDRTGEQVSIVLPDVVVVKGTGSLFWNRGMCWAYAAARRQGSFDAYLLFNDDVKIFADQVSALMSDFDTKSVLVGATVSSAHDNVTYTAMCSLSKYKPLSFRRIEPNGELQACDAFNGNFVLVPGPFFEEVGGLDPRYLHGFGDVDLGLTARRMGVQVYLWRRPIGECDLNVPMKIEGEGLIQRFSRAFTGKQDLFKHVYFLVKHGPKWLAPLYFANVVLARIRAVLSVR